MSSEENFRRIFSDARVCDLDFSEWDKLVRIVVLADHMPHRKHRLPVFVVEFIGVRHFCCDYVWGEVEMTDLNQHCQWSLHDVIVNQTVESQKPVLPIRLRSPGPGPDLIIKCESYKIREIEIEVLDGINPEWDKPYSPLARVSIEKIYEMLQTDQNDLKRKQS